MTDKMRRPGLGLEYLQSMRYYVDAGGELDGDNACALLDEVERSRNDIIEECALAAERALTNSERLSDKQSEGLLRRACDNIRALKI
jgi:hypothetical protein